LAVGDEETKNNCKESLDGLAPTCDEVLIVAPRAEKSILISGLLPPTNSLITIGEIRDASSPDSGVQVMSAADGVGTSCAGSARGIAKGDVIQAIQSLPVLDVHTFIVGVRDVVMAVGNRHRVPKLADPMRRLNTAQAKRDRATATAATADSTKMVDNATVEVMVRAKDPSLPTPSVVACTFSAHDLIDAALAADSVGTGVVKFSVEFADDGTTPQFSTGYFSVTGEIPPNGDQLATAVYGSGMFGAIWDPSVLSAANDATAIVTGLPLQQSGSNQFTTNAQVGFKEQFGNRADADALFTYASGDLGQKQVNAQTTQGQNTLTPTVDRYVVNVHSRADITTSVGRMVVASPPSGLPIADKADAIRLNVRGNYSATVILNLQGVPGKADAAGQDNRAFLVQAENVSVKSVVVYGSLLWGKDSAPATGHGYETFGGEAMKKWGGGSTHEDPYWTSSLSVAAYRSVLHNSGSAVGAQGLVTLAVVRELAEPSPSEVGFQVPWSVVFTYGEGKGYLGEDPAFAPDSIFLATLVPKSDLGAGLTNKRYISASESIPTPVLKWLAKRVFQSLDEDLKSERLTIAERAYWLITPIAPQMPHVAGWEADAAWQLMNTSKVTPGILLAMFDSGKGIRPALSQCGLVWSVAATLSVSFGG
jgi:hypothetical protein